MVLGSSGAMAKTLQRVHHIKTGNPVSHDQTIPESPLLRFKIIRSGYVGSSGESPSIQSLASTSSHPVMSTATSRRAYQQSGIQSFRLLEIDLDPMDFTGQEPFLVGLFSFVTMLPFDDVAQSEVWQQRQVQLFKGQAVNPSYGNELRYNWLQPARTSSCALEFLQDKLMGEAQVCVSYFNSQLQTC